MTKGKKHDQEYKTQAVKLAQEIGAARAADELGIPRNTMYGWMRAVRNGQLDVGKGTHSPHNALTLNEEMIMLRKQIKALEKENKRIKEENESLAEASVFLLRAVGSRKKRKAKIHCPKDR